MTHTQGPWNVVRTDCMSDNGPVLRIAGAHPAYDVESGVTPRWEICVALIEDTDNPMADARLISASPAMLSALRELVNWFGDVRDDWAGWDGGNEVLDQAEAAIAKATKEEPDA